LAYAAIGRSQFHGQNVSWLTTYRLITSEPSHRPVFLGHKTFSNMKLLLLLLLLLPHSPSDIKANQNGISIISERYNRISKGGGGRAEKPTSSHTQRHTQRHTHMRTNVVMWHACFWLWQLFCWNWRERVAHKRFVRKFQQHELTPTQNRHTHTHTHTQFLGGCGNCVKRDFRFSTNVSLSKCFEILQHVHVCICVCVCVCICVCVGGCVAIT